MIVAGSAWTSDQVDYAYLIDGSDPDFSAWEFDLTFFTRVGDQTAASDDYGTNCAVTPSYLLRKAWADGGVVVDDADAGIVHFALTAADTETIRRALGRDVWKPRLLTIQLRRTDTDDPQHIQFFNEMFVPGGAA